MEMPSVRPYSASDDMDVEDERIAMQQHQH
jgi:hypothetical protein